MNSSKRTQSPPRSFSHCGPWALRDRDTGLQAEHRRADRPRDTVFSDNGDVSVRTTVMPELVQGDKIELLVDGFPAGPPATTAAFLFWIAHGLHVLQA